jgi:hypothetical protein
MPSVGFEPTIPASARPQTYALDSATTGIGIILPVILPGYVTFSVQIKKEHFLRMFENMILKGIFKYRGKKTYKDGRKLYFEEIHNLYSLLRIVGAINLRIMGLKGYVACIRARKHIWNIIGVNLSKRPLRKSWSRRENII